MKNNITDILCVGHASWDLVFTTDHHPAPDEKMFADKMLSMGGGPAANAAVTAARLGCRTAFIGYLGNDIFGNMHMKELERENINTQYIFRGNMPTPVSSIYVKPEGARSVVNYKQGLRPQPAESLNEKTLEKLCPKIMVLDSHEPYISQQMVHWANKHGITTILDAGSVREGTRLLADKVDILAVSEKFAHDMTNETNPKKALDALAEINPCVIITLGERGLIWRMPKDSGALPAYQVKAVDTTGAGDVFHGALAVALVKNMSWEKSLQYASTAAALCCTVPGARSGIPRKNKLKTF